MRTCIKCEESKKLSEFQFTKVKNIYARKCLECINLIRRTKKRLVRGLTPDAIMPMGPKVGIRKPKKKWSEYSKEQRVAWTKKYKEANKVIINEKNKQYARNNYEKRKITMRLYRVRTKDVQASYVRKRQASKLQRTPSWVDSEELWLIKEVYALAALRTKMFGFSWHVDHIVPLQGKLVSGLHTIANLQVIPAIDNIRKQNRFEVS
jgi:hypothetical protein